jgi:hypothetical protein
LVAGVVVDGDADAAGVASGRVLVAAVVPPVVREVGDRGNLAAAYGVDRGADGDAPVPRGKVVMGGVDVRVGK